MKHYIRSAKSAGSWQDMANNRPVGHMDSAVESWLRSDEVISFTANSLEILNAAFMYVIKKVTNLTGIMLVAGAAGTLTLLDRIAMFLVKAAKVSKDLNIWVYHLVKKMAALIGMKIKEGIDLTVAFIHTVFICLHRKISEMIWRIGQEISEIPIFTAV